MFGIANSVLWLLGIVFMGAVMLGLRHYFSVDAKAARRRARAVIDKWFHANAGRPSDSRSMWTSQSADGNAEPVMAKAAHAPRTRLSW